VFQVILVGFQLGNRCSIRLSYGAVAQEDSAQRSGCKSTRHAVHWTTCRKDDEADWIAVECEERAMIGGTTPSVRPSRPTGVGRFDHIPKAIPAVA
jgi:hypothetical protein